MYIIKSTMITLVLSASLASVAIAEDNNISSNSTLETISQTDNRDKDYTRDRNFNDITGPRFAPQKEPLLDPNNKPKIDPRYKPKNNPDRLNSSFNQKVDPPRLDHHYDDRFDDKYDRRPNDRFDNKYDRRFNDKYNNKNDHRVDKQSRPPKKSKAKPHKDFKKNFKHPNRPPRGQGVKPNNRPQPRK